MPCVVRFFGDDDGRKPVREFLDALSKAERAKVFQVINLLREKGLQLPFPWSSQVGGKLRELRVHYGRATPIERGNGSSPAREVQTMTRPSAGKRKAVADAATDVERYFAAQMKDPEFARAYREGLDELKIAVQIAQLRGERRLSRSRLAARAGTSQAVIARIETEHALPDVSTLTRIANALGAKLSLEFVPVERSARRRRAA